MNIYDEGDSSIFESAADFFSFVTLAAIYALVAFGGQSGLSNFESQIREQPFEVGATTEDEIYIAIEQSSDLTVRITVIDLLVGESDEREFTASSSLVDDVRIWMESRLLDVDRERHLTLRLATPNEPPELSKLFLAMIRYLKNDQRKVDIGV